VSRLVWLLAGLLGGLVVGRNAEPMIDPAGAAVVLALLVGCGLCWTAGYRGKSVAVATAVAQAQAVAAADAEANAAAIANAAVHLHLEQLGHRVGSAVLEHDQADKRSLERGEQITDSSARLWVPARSRP
jgi:ApbE superfamily uncharacterized protein (UPF0280 family)